MSSTHPQPSWDELLEIAVQQEGLFSTTQAAGAGFSSQLLAHHVRARRITRVRRGIYRVRHLPHGEHEDLLIAWLWSGQEGVVSHATALARHGLSDLLPSGVDLTVPLAWRRRRLRVPKGLRLHFADLDEGERRWHGPVPITSVARSIRDYAALPGDPLMVEQAVAEARDRGLVEDGAIADVLAAMEPWQQPLDAGRPGARAAQVAEGAEWVAKIRDRGDPASAARGMPDSTRGGRAHRHELVFRDPGHGPSRLGPSRLGARLIVETLRTLLDGCRRAARFAIEGRSDGPHDSPEWLELACNIEVQGLDRRSAVVGLEAADLDAVVATAGLTAGWMRPDHPRLGSAMRAFRSCIASALAADGRWLDFDRPLLAACAAFARAATSDGRHVTVRELDSDLPSLTLGPADAQALETLRDRTPTPQAVRVRGRLDSITASDASALVLLDDGSSVRIRTEAIEVADLRGLFGTDVVVSGMAQFRSDGDVLYIDAEFLGASTDGDRAFSDRPRGSAELPAPVVTEPDAATPVEKAGVAAFFGIWPGDESLDDLLRGLADTR